MKVAFKIWLYSSVLLSISYGMSGCIIHGELNGYGFFNVLFIFISLIITIPAFLVLLFAVYRIKKLNASTQTKIWLLIAVCFVCSSGYGILSGNFLMDILLGGKLRVNDLLDIPISISILFICNLLSIFLSYKTINTTFFNSHFSSSQISNMENQSSQETIVQSNKSSNKVLIKGAITGALILFLLIPVAFVSNLVTERQERQQQIVQEVSSKWAGAQTLTVPYIYIPYTVKSKDDTGKETTEQKKLLLLPNNLQTEGTMIPEIRPRSIYKVLLYKSNLNFTGNFNIQIPNDIDVSSLQLNDAKICFGLTDFKGIEEKLSVTLNGNSYELSPGLPCNDIDSTGLSSPINFTVNDLNRAIDFKMNVSLKGSGSLHFVPLSGNSSFVLHSNWINPSFDGNNLPRDRNITDKDFNAQWTFNKANLPFSTCLKEIKFNKDNYAFGVTMLQPADQYSKTMRSIKYAILFIGLTFALFFIIEIMQKKPLHPVQYAMVGIALIIFFTLLLSISEFILFDPAYLIASIATIVLITLYAQSHFKSLKIASVFAGILSALYGFIFILIRLEDTALLVGSIGLFAVLALVMYASRKVNWYNSTI
jgi:inner membrane protein